LRNIFHGVLLFFVICLFLASSDGISVASAPMKVDVRVNSHMPFISNDGQFDANVKYYAKTFGGTVFVTENGQWIYSLPRKGKTIADYKSTIRSKPHKDKKEPVRGFAIEGLSLREELVGGKIHDIKGEGASTKKVNYFRGSDHKKWKTNITTFDLLNLGEVYEGIQLKLKAYSNNMEKLFYVKPGSKPEDIKVKLTGAQSLAIAETGELTVKTDLGKVIFTKPVAYQWIDKKRVEISANYYFPHSQAADADSRLIYGFRLGDYDKTREVVIDPLLYSTYLGGSGSDLALGGTIDSNGNIYVAGVTSSYDFPTTSGAFDRGFNGGNTDFFISKISPSGDLVYSTYIGGSANDYDASAGEPYVFGMTIDSSGNVYMTGQTFSSDFPTTTGALSRTLKGNSDAFVLKLHSAGDSLIYSTFIGGSGDDQGAGIAVDASGYAYVAGTTWSSDFPTTTGAFDRTHHGGDSDMFAIKLNPAGSSLVYSTFLGGSGWDQATKIAIDNSGNAYILGGGNSTDYPTTTGAYDRSGDGTFHDIYLTKLNATGSGIVASTFLGGSNKDWAESISIDYNGNVFIAGDTQSSDFPTTPGAYDRNFEGPHGGYISKFDSNLGTLLASTYFKGFPSVTTDSSGNVYAAGITGSSSFPTTPGAYDNTFHGGVSNGGLLLDGYCAPSGCDAFVSKLDNNLTTILASTFLGGSGNETCGARLSSGKVFLICSTTSTDLPIKNGFDRTHNGSEDVFVAVLDANLSSAWTCTNQPAQINGVPYTSISEAYTNAAVSGDIIKVLAADQSGPIDLSDSKSIALHGGFTCDFNTPIAITTVIGTLTITGGTVELSDLIIQ